MVTEEKISIIIPAFNEEAVIESFLGKLKQALAGVHGSHEIIVVDDGSTDNTFAVAGNIPEVKVIRHPYNKGNGAAVKTGIFEAGGEKLVIIDADGQHDPEHIPEMLGLLNEYDLVVGARESFGVGKRGFGNVVVSKLASYLSGIDIPDLTCGFRTFKREKMLEFIDLLPNGYSLPSTSTLAFATSGYNVKFIPITAHVRQGGKSSIHVVKDGTKFLVLIFRMISLFKPLKIYTPVSIFLLSIGLFWAIRSYYIKAIISPLGTMILLAGLFTFLFGLMVDQLAQARLTLGKLIKYQIKKNEKDQ
ncbi:MAG: glycosyltransferase family 2 protein [Promethearchaeota archaeon]|jgi:glycosyltransferase involved in cell wall biosynthesis